MDLLLAQRPPVGGRPPPPHRRRSRGSRRPVLELVLQDLLLDVALGKQLRLEGIYSSMSSDGSFSTTLYRAGP